ncbi:HAD-IB family phosphatase [Roseibacillus ishigakijimensis]|uniref:phosphoserine phosphatase n=1 Tax=Roseibacillus ishigakijimensis TaxID=454146 RepID=A0A934VN65_9BACT|nr:HAD-IB family phosphatase [Roseibacillus ishigakijimensis]MBK1834796.1 HAD-IB family phosphatase [Roseibacillus ishigakijimensis]
MKKLLFLDCDSTLCAIEGVDELAALRGPEVESQVIDLTNEAMDGTVPIDEVFGRRLDLIKPSREMCVKVGEMYIQRLSPGVDETLLELRAKGWEPIIISGGFTQVIEPVAHHLNIEQIFAVDLIFNPDGSYQNFDKESPTARNGGKPDIIKSILCKEKKTSAVMVGDGISDLETKGVVDLFVGFGGVVKRKTVQMQSQAFVTHFAELPKVITDYLSK